MHYLNRDKRDIADTKCRAAYSKQIYLRNAGVLMFRKYIRELAHKRRLHPRICVDIHWPLLFVIKGPYVIHARNMVFMLMCIYQAIQMLNIGAKHLISEIGP